MHARPDLLAGGMNEPSCAASRRFRARLEDAANTPVLAAQQLHRSYHEQAVQPYCRVAIGEPSHVQNAGTGPFATGNT